MADFEVAFSNGKVIPYSGERSRYLIDDAQGVLTVYDGKGQRFRFSPSGWVCVQDAEPKSAYETEDLKTV